MRLASAAACVLVLTAACGTETPGADPVERRPAAEGSWASHHLAGTPGVDFPTILATDGDDVLAVMLSDEGVLQSHVSVGDDDFERGEPLRTDQHFAGLAGAVPHDDGWFTVGSGGLARVDGDEELLFEAVAFRSDDGLHWAEVAVEGFTGPADVNALVEVDGTLVAAGAYRDSDNPAMGGFRPMVWRSQDGASWTEVPLPGVADDGDSSVADLAVVAGRVVAVGGSGGAGMLWTSDDAGASWQASEQRGIQRTHSLTRVSEQGGTLVVSAMPQGDQPPTIYRSTDGGGSWAAASGQPPARDIEGYAPLWSGGGRFFSLTSSYVESWNDPETCYADITLCQQDSSVALYASDDGETWTRVDTSGIGSGEEGEVDEATATDDGRVVAMQVGTDGVELHVWPAGVDLPVTSEAVEPAEVELVTVPKDGVLEPGVRYHAPLYVHCGMDWLHLGDRGWRRSDGGPDVETGAGDVPDPSWPLAQQTIFGFATLTDEGVVEYSLGDGEVIATYERANGQFYCE